MKEREPEDYEELGISPFDCPECYGNGTNDDGEDCSVCHGTGQRQHDPQDE